MNASVVAMASRLVARTLLARRLQATACSSRGVVSRVVESPFTPVRPVPDCALPDYVWDKLPVCSQHPAITCGLTGATLTYSEARDATRRLAWALRAQLGLRTGDVLGVLLPNLPEYLVTIHGAIEAGLVVTFVNPLYTPDEVERQFRQAGVTCCVTVPSLSPVATQVTAALPGYRGTVLVGPANHSAEGLAFSRLLQDASPNQLPQLKASDVAVLPFSSGTTGLPKGVELTHANMVASLEQGRHPAVEEFGKTVLGEPNEPCLTVLPFFHIYGFNGILNVTMIHGLHLITLPRFVPEDYVAALVKHKPEVLFVVPSLLLFLAAHPAVTPKHLESVQKVVCGAAAATPALIERFHKKLGRDGVSVRQGYGMTELSPLALFPPCKAGPDKVGSCGQVVVHTQARVVDLETGDDLGPNLPGELWFRGPQVMRGYRDNSEATNAMITPDGWLKTGDVATYDDDGFFYIVDRTKELIKVRGNQVSPTELENLIMQIAGVADVAVVGVEDEISGELPLAFVVLQPKATVTETQIQEFVRPKVASYKKLAAGVRFIEVIPRNPSGKVLRQQLKALIREATT